LIIDRAFLVATQPRRGVELDRSHLTPPCSARLLPRDSRFEQAWFDIAYVVVPEVTASPTAVIVGLREVISALAGAYGRTYAEGTPMPRSRTPSGHGSVGESATAIRRATLVECRSVAGADAAHM
jgi:hypothetical protein